MDANSPFSPDSRLNKQISFLSELDKLKEILRRSRVAGSQRLENSAEHSWHLAMMAMILLEYAQVPPINPHRVLKMLLVHDIVEIDAGDTFCYDVAGNVTKAEREIAAATRIFSLLPQDQAEELREIWDEFEAGVSSEAKLAQSLDRLHPILQNLRTGGASWRQYRVTKAQVLERNRKIEETMPEIWAALTQQLDRAETQGFFESPEQNI